MLEGEGRGYGEELVAVVCCCCEMKKEKKEKSGEGGPFKNEMVVPIEAISLAG